MERARVKRTVLLLCLFFAVTLAVSPDSIGAERAQAKPARPAGESALTLENVLKRMAEAADHLKSLTANIERTKVTVVVDDKDRKSVV